MDNKTIIKLLTMVHDELLFGSQVETEIAIELRRIVNKLKNYYLTSK